jgi:hypothetical protein
VTANDSLALGGLPASSYVTKSTKAKAATKAARRGHAVWVRCRVQSRAGKPAALCYGSRRAVRRLSR